MAGREKWQCRIAPSLGGGFEGTPNETWGTVDYTDNQCPTVFFGLYGLPDFYTLWNHKGRKAILWAGSDIRHFVNGYWLEDNAKGIKIEPRVLAPWINKHCENWVENEKERRMLKEYGINLQVCPSFLGDVNKFDLSYRWSKKPKVYTSVSGDDFRLYGWYDIDTLARKNSDIEFHLYGNKKEWKTRRSNVFVHGQVSKEKMNKEIKEMQGAIRLVDLEGFSEIVAKSLLWGQWPISVIDYPFTLPMSDLEILKYKKTPNISGQDYYRGILNRYPWNSNL